MLVFYLFRIRLYRSGPVHHHPTRRDWIGELIRQQPAAEACQAGMWRMDNATAIGGHGLLFTADRSASAFAVYDGEYGILSLAPPQPARPAHAMEMARGLQTLLNMHACAHDDIRIEITPVIDPEGFLDHIMEAFAITEFSVQCGEPNALEPGHGPFAPMQAMLERAGGEQVRISMLGEDLDREMLEPLVRAAAGEGHEVRIRLREAMGRKPISRRMRGHTIDFLVRREDIPGRADTVLAMARQIFLHIRGEQ